MPLEEISKLQDQIIEFKVKYGATNEELSAMLIPSNKNKK